MSSGRSAIKKNPALSVLLSTKNHSRWIEQCISCILDQSFQDFEFLILDDGSTDTTPNLLKSLQKKDSRIHLLHHKKSRGVIESYNRLAKLASGQYLFFCASDDYVHDPSFFQAGIENLRKHPRLGAFFSNCQVFSVENDEKLETWGWKGRPRLFQRDEALKHYLNGFLRLPGASTILRRDLFLKAGGYNRSLGPLSDLAINLLVSLDSGIYGTGKTSVTIRVFSRKFSFGTSVDEEKLLALFCNMEKRLRKVPLANRINQVIWQNWRIRTFSECLHIEHLIRSIKKKQPSERPRKFLQIEKKINNLFSRYAKTVSLDVKIFPRQFSTDLMAYQGKMTFARFLKRNIRSLIKRIFALRRFAHELF
jgi:glycosyltransferase involved in cell wall biosynthesis